ncbi:MAG: homoserine kinase [Flavobacteriales bacterium]|nr:homoserine kinase [Flavobacteriales bacterium]
MADYPRVISATAPPTIANLAVGFDILGLAVKGNGDIVKVSKGERAGVNIVRIEGDEGRLSRSADKNTATAGIASMLQDLGRSDSLSIELEKRMPLGSGMGSSASSAAAGVLAVNEFFGRPFRKEELVKYALIGESVASGSVHGDNVVPCLLGGLILMRRNEASDVIRLPFIDELVVLLIHPHVEVMTAQSRGRLRSEVKMREHILQSSDTASFIHAMHTGDRKLLRRCMNDHIIAPQRKADIPLFNEVREVVLKKGAYNYDISGSGPSSFAFFDDETSAKKALEDVKSVFANEGIACDIEITQVDNQGARIL